MRYNKLQTSCLYKELSTNGDEPKSPSFTSERKGNLDSLHSTIFNFNNRSKTYFYWMKLIPASDFSISKPRNCFNNPRSIMENLLCNEDLIEHMSTMKLPVIKISSTYSTMTCNESPIFYKCKLGSYFHLSKPSEGRKLSILAYQALGDCLRP